MATAADCEQSSGFSPARLFSSFVVLVFEESDGRAELLNVMGSDDAGWDDFALLLSPIGIRRLLEGGGVLWEDDAAGERRCEALAENDRRWRSASEVSMIEFLRGS